MKKMTYKGAKKRLLNYVSVLHLKMEIRVRTDICYKNEIQWLYMINGLLIIIYICMD